MLYFQNCTTLPALRKELRRLAKVHHPDVGGSLATMQEINAEYEQAKKRLSAPATSRVYACPNPGHGRMMTLHNGFITPLRGGKKLRKKLKILREQDKGRGPKKGNGQGRKLRNKNNVC
jgi:hypothetical protein